MAERWGAGPFGAARTADGMPETVDEDENLQELPGTADEDGSLQELPGTADEDGSLQGLPGTADEDGSLQELPGTADGDGSLQGRADGEEDSGGRRGRHKGSAPGFRGGSIPPAGKRASYGKMLRDLVPWLAAFLILLAVTQGIAAAVRIRQEARRAELSRLYGVQYEWK